MSAPDLRTVSKLCELVLAARRLGCTMRIIDPDPGLRELIALAGVDDVLLAEPTTVPGRREVRGPLR